LFKKKKKIKKKKKKKKRDDGEVDEKKGRGKKSRGKNGLARLYAMKAQFPINRACIPAKHAIEQAARLDLYR